MRSTGVDSSRNMSDVRQVRVLNLYLGSLPKEEEIATSPVTTSDALTSS